MNKLYKYIYIHIMHDEEKREKRGGEDASEAQPTSKSCTT